MEWNNWLFTNYTRHIESYDHTNWCWAELECEVTRGIWNCQSVQTCFTIQCEISLWETQAADVLPRQFLACCALQGIPSLSAHSWALCKNGTRKYTNVTVIPMISALCYIFTSRWTAFVTQTIHCVLCWLQHIGQILIYSESNIRHLIKHWR